MKKNLKNNPKPAEVDPAFAPVVAGLTKHRNVTTGKMMASYGLKVNGKIYMS